MGHFFPIARKWYDRKQKLQCHLSIQAPLWAYDILPGLRHSFSTETVSQNIRKVNTKRNVRKAPVFSNFYEEIRKNGHHNS